MSDKLPSHAEIRDFANAAEELDAAFDTISGENDRIYEVSDPAASMGGGRLPTHDEIAALADAQDDLERAFESISSVNARIEAPKISVLQDKGPSVSFVENESNAAFEEDFALDDVALRCRVAQTNSDDERLRTGWSACRPRGATSSAWQRLRCCAALAQVTALCHSDDAVAAATQDRLARLAAQSATLESLEPYSKERLAAEVEMERELALFEADLEQRERTIATSWLRGEYLDLDLDVATKASYFGSIVQRADLSPEWWDRVTILALASATKRTRTGELELMAVDDLAILWDRILPDSTSSARSIGASVEFFHDAIGRLRALDSVSELFSSGFYLDVVGYQVSLRDEFFRPEILYAAVDFSTELTNWLNNGENRVLRASREADIVKVYADVRAIFQSQFKDDGGAERLRARLRGEKARKEKAARDARRGTFGKNAAEVGDSRRSSRFRTALVVAAAATLLLLGLPLVKEVLGERSRDLEGVTATQAAQIHPLLISGHEGKQASLLVANVDADKWVLLSAEQRAAMADELIDALGDRHLRSAMLYNGSLLVMQIAEGELRYLE